MELDKVQQVHDQTHHETTTTIRQQQQQQQQGPSETTPTRTTLVQNEGQLETIEDSNQHSKRALRRGGPERRTNGHY